MSDVRIHRLRFAAALVMASLIAPDNSARASQVVTMNLQTLADHAGQVIVGRVASVRSHWADNPKRIESEIILEQVEYLKGTPVTPPTSVSLVVPGGTVGSMQMRIACAPTFITGEKWILLLLPTYKTFPVVGLSRGAFRVERDTNGVERVYDAARTSVIGVDRDGFVQVAGEAQAAAHLVGAINARVAQPVTVRKSSQQAVSYDDFLARLRPVLSKSTDHRLTQPAGRRILASHTPVPLRSSFSETARFGETKGSSPAGIFRAVPTGERKSRGNR